MHTEDAIFAYLNDEDFVPSSPRMFAPTLHAHPVGWAQVNYDNFEERGYVVYAIHYDTVNDVDEYDRVPGVLVYRVHMLVNPQVYDNLMQQGHSGSTLHTMKSVWGETPQHVIDELHAYVKAYDAYWDDVHNKRTERKAKRIAHQQAREADDDMLDLASTFGNPNVVGASKGRYKSKKSKPKPKAKKTKKRKTCVRRKK